MTFNAFKLTLFLNELYRFLDVFDTMSGAGISASYSCPVGWRLKP